MSAPSRVCPKGSDGIYSHIWDANDRCVECGQTLPEETRIWHCLGFTDEMHPWCPFETAGLEAARQHAKQYEGHYCVAKDDPEVAASEPQRPHMYWCPRDYCGWTGSRRPIGGACPECLHGNGERVMVIEG